jgi:cell division protein FtsB
MPPRRQARRPPVTTLARRWSAVVVVAVVAYFYYHPLRAYLSARHELGARSAEVEQLAAQKRELQRRLSASTSLVALAHEARELGYVRPGEHLYIVKGIAAWRHAHSTIAKNAGGP